MAGWEVPRSSRSGLDRGPLTDGGPTHATDFGLPPHVDVADAREPGPSSLPPEEASGVASFVRWRLVGRDGEECEDGTTGETDEPERHAGTRRVTTGNFCDL